jgi:hypothetical protein
VPDYGSLLATRRFIGLMSRHNTVAWIIAILVANVLASGVIACASTFLVAILLVYVVGGDFYGIAGPLFAELAFITGISSMITSSWLWLYAGAAFLLKGARRVDALVGWMNTHMDIERKPLRSIGIVAGAIVALVYWAAVAVMRWV